MLTNIDLDTAQHLLLQRVNPLPVEDVLLGDAVGRINGLELIAPVNLPPCPQAAMDGFAIHPFDLGASDLLRIRLLDYLDIADYSLQPGEAVRVNTGFPLPQSTGAVVPVEDVHIRGEYLLT